MTHPIDFAYLINQYIEDAGLSSDRLSQLSHVPKSTIINWRTGVVKHPQQWQGLVRIAAALELSMSKADDLLAAAGHPSIITLLQRELVGEDRRLLRSWDQNDNRQATQRSPVSAQTEPAAVHPLRVREPDEQTSVRRDPAGQSTPEDVRFTEEVEITEDVEITEKGPRLFIVLALFLGLAALITAVIMTRIWLNDGYPIPRAEADVQYFAIGQWENLSPNPSAYELALSHDTRNVLYTKLGQSAALLGISKESSQVFDNSQPPLNFWIEGSYQQLDTIQLSANVFGGDGTFIDSVTVESGIDLTGAEAEVCILDMQSQLAEGILTLLHIKTPDETLSKLSVMPTSNCEALRLNNGAAELILRGSYLSAEHLLRRALALDPDYADVYNNLGQVAYRKGEWLASIPFYTQAIDRDPTDAVYYYNLGLAYERLAQYEESVRAYERAIELDPYYVEAFNNLGFTYMLMDRFDEAAESLKTGLGLAPDAEYLHKNMGRVYLAWEDPASAVGALENAISLSAGDVYPEALYYLTLAYEQLDQVNNACVTLDEYLSVAEYDDAERAQHATELISKLGCAFD